MIKLIVFDYDGTLLDCSSLHYEALNAALTSVDQKFAISYDRHTDELDSLTTADKLMWYHKNMGLPIEAFDGIKLNKSKNFDKLIDLVNVDTPNIVRALTMLKNDGFVLAVSSNASKAYVNMMLKRQSIDGFFDRVYTREDCTHTKPHPEIYMRLMVECGVAPSETLVLEDSPVGHRSAHESGAHLLVVENVADVTYENVIAKIKRCTSRIEHDRVWHGDNINVVIPMAGAGARFQRAGYAVPKPLIDVNGMPMVQQSIDGILLPNAQYTFIVQKEHDEKYGMSHLLRALRPGANIVTVNGLTDGAARTVLHAKEFIDNDNHLVISNCDQRVELNWCSYFNRIVKRRADASMVCFEEKANETKWSYAVVDDEGWITSVKEKVKISDYATCGIYHFTRGSDFVAAAETMIAENDRVNNEFYVAPVYNHLSKARIMNFLCDRMIGLGTPDDLRRYTENDFNSA